MLLLHPSTQPSCTPTAFHWNRYAPRVLRAPVSDEPCYRDRLLWTASWKTISFVPCLPAGLHFKYSSQDGPLFSLLLDPGPQPPPVSIPGVAMPFSVLSSYCLLTWGWTFPPHPAHVLLLFAGQRRRPVWHLSLGLPMAVLGSQSFRSGLCIDGTSALARHARDEARQQMGGCLAGRGPWE